MKTSDDIASAYQKELRIHEMGYGRKRAARLMRSHGVAFAVGVLAILGVSACGGAADDQNVESSSSEERVEGAAMARMTSLELADLIAEDDPRLHPLDTLTVPSSGYSDASDETEPNDTREEATPLGPNRVVRGMLEDRDRDYFSFEVAHPSQRWLIEAQGDGISGLTYHSPGGERTSSKPAPDDPTRQVISNLFLLPGTHYVEVRSGRAAGDYALRIVPLGAPDPLAEREPNSDESRAHRLAMGTARHGHLFETGDRDYYYFTLEAEAQVLIQCVPPPGITTRMTLSLQTTGNRTTQVMGMESDTTGTKLVYRGRLYPGTYFLNVANEKQGSIHPYALRVDRLDPFAVPVDREPNDAAEEAATLPEDLVVHGYVGEHHRDEDWFRLPVLTAKTAVTATLSGEVLQGPRLQNTLAFFSDDGALRDVAWRAQDSLFAGTLPAATPLYARVRGRGSYRVVFAFDPGPPPQERPMLPVTITLSRGPHTVAAYWHEGQRVELPFTLTYRGKGRRTLTLEAVSSHPAWHPVLADSSLTLRAGEEAEVPLTVAIRPDAWADRPVHITVRASDEQGGWRSAHATFVAACGATPVQPEQAWPVPEALLGGFNVAAAALGSTYDRSDEALFDGLTANDQGWRAKLPATVTVVLPGPRPIRVAGVLLHPQNGRPLPYRARDFDVAVSLDSTTFTPVLEGTLDRYPIEQAFVFEGPVEARFVRLHVRSSYSGIEGTVNLGEFKVVATPEAPPDLPSINLADPALGGHVVWSDPVHPAKPVILTEEKDAPTLRLDPLNPSAWVIGFHHGRAAQVRELQWVQPASTRSNASFMSSVQVAVSTETPLGPWTPLGTWALDTEAGSPSAWRLPEPVWARYVRFSSTEPDRPSLWRLPETLRIFEHGMDATYRSILGEWGHYTQPAVYEWTYPPETDWMANEADGNDSRETAQALALDAPARGAVLVGEDEDWYRIQVPEEDNRLSLDLAGDPVLRARFTLFDGEARPVPLETVERPDGQPPRYEAQVTPGAAYYLHLDEPPRSIAFVWDNSASVGPFKPTIYQTMARFAEGIRPGREYANLWPFAHPGAYLREEWADQPERLLQTLGTYDRRDNSSSAEDNLYGAVSKMGRREGTKAIILLTDADSPSYRSTPLLWRSLAEVQPRIFALELHRGNVARHQDLMQSWAYAGRGLYDHFSSNADLEVGLERATCTLRRPARYRLTAHTRYETPPGPGYLAVTAAEPVVGQGAIELILDASGSMLQRLGGKRRIAIAREVLASLVTETLPPGTPLALRVFGHRTPDACQTDLEVPLAPLQPERVARLIAGIDAKNLARTPIAQSLELVAQDLEGVEGRRLVLLITDGEETCDGDPAAVIQQLKDDGFDIRLNIVGFAIDDAALKAEFESWAGLGGGRYLDARSSDELTAAVGAALRPKFQVFDAGGSVVAEGTVNRDSVAVPAGTYSVKVLTSPPQLFDAVRITSEATAQLDVSPTP